MLLCCCRLQQWIDLFPTRHVEFLSQVFIVVWKLLSTTPNLFVPYYLRQPSFNKTECSPSVDVSPPMNLIFSMKCIVMATIFFLNEAHYVISIEQPQSMSCFSEHAQKQAKIKKLVLHVTRSQIKFVLIHPKLSISYHPPFCLQP